MPSAQRITLVAAGAGAGIAATFNTPIGGVLFATELMLPEVSVNTFLPVALATGSATFIGRLFFGDAARLRRPRRSSRPCPIAAGSALTLVLYAVLGALAGVGRGAVRALAALDGGCCSTASPAAICATPSACCWSAC